MNAFLLLLFKNCGKIKRGASKGKNHKKHDDLAM